MFFGTGDFTIDAWAYPRDTDWNIITSNRDGAPYTATEFNFQIRGDTQKLSLATGLAYLINSNTSISQNVWTHVAVTRSGTTLKLFINGVVDASVTDSTVFSQQTQVNIGSFEAGDGSFNGNLDEFRILKGRALTTEEIKAAASRRPYAVYTSPVMDATASTSWNTVNWTEGGVRTGDGEIPYSTNSLVAQWNFNDTSGTTLTASSSGSCTTACNGTLTNFVSTGSQDAAAGTGWTANNKRWGAGGLMISGVATADLISITDPASNVLDPNSADLTIETWIKTNDASAEIFSNNNANGTACTGNGYYLGVDASGYPLFIWTPTAPPPVATLPPPANLKSTTATGTRWPFPSPGELQPLFTWTEKRPAPTHPLPHIPPLP